MDDDDDLDIENNEYNIDELESMLYSKIHHEEISEDIHPVIPSEETTIVSRSNKSRYWNQTDKGSPGPSSNSNSNSTNINTKAFNKKSRYQFRKKLNETQNDSNQSENNQEVVVTPFIMQPFAPYQPIMENSCPSNNTNESDNITTNKISNLTDNVTVNNGNVMMKNGKKKTKNQSVHGPFKESIKKLDKLQKLQSKKNRADKSRKSTKKHNVNNNNQVHIISLDSSDDESEDVIEIKLPPPPLVTIDDSSEEEGDEELDTSMDNNFAKPKDINFQSNKKQQQDSSRCTTPCSIISDDFIGQVDRTGLILSENPMNANDDDLNFTPVTVSNFIENSKQIKKNELFNINLTPINTTKQKNQKRNENTDFRVSKENCGGAIDVYESESDLTESIYTKGSSSANAKSLNNSKKQKEIILSSDSDDDDIFESLPKSKRFRKRRASSMNKDSEPNNGESTSDTDMDYNKSSSRLSFVKKGEAIERYKNVLLPRKISTNLDNSNCSDTEFLSKLNSIVQGRISDNDSNSSDNENTITARIIAEDVLSTLHNDNRIKYMESDMNNTNESASIEMEVVNSLDISENFEELSTIQSMGFKECFDEIDNMFPSDEKLNKKSKISCKNLPVESESDINLFRDPPAPSPLILNRKKNSNSKNVSKSVKKKLEKPKEFEKSDDNETDSSFCVVESNVDFHIGWTDEQIKFYNNSWGGENFNVNKIKKSMDRNARWTIYSEDRFPKYLKKSPLKCNNCSDFGHMQSRCPQPRKPIVCYMCGDTGHKEPRCPNTICLRCGNKTRVFTKICNACAHQNKQICSLCKLRGHSYEFCTDRWRRYHSTTSPNHKLNDTVVYNKIKFCCICAKRGHLSQDCRSVYRFSEYPLTCTDIKSHSISYQEDEGGNENSSSSNTIQYNLLYQPDTNIQFNFSYNTELNENKFYDRFVKAVNLKLPSRVKHTYKPIETNVSEMNEESDSQLNTNIALNAETIKNEVDFQDKNEDTPENEDISENESGIDDTPENVRGHDGSTASNMPSQSDNSQNNFQDDEFKLDSDSNYSFSEHFSGKYKQTQSNERTTSESFTNDSLPEYISFNENPSNDNNKDIAEYENQLTQIGISNKFQLSDDDDDNDRDFQLSNIPCVAKILLKRHFSEYLLSSEGNKYLIESSNRFNVKASIDWSSVGNVLILEGLPVDQDSFHSELLVTFHKTREKTIRKQFDENLKVPKKRIALIRFLSNDIMYLQRKIGDASDLVKQLIICENQNSNKGFKMADKIRRNLNMILYGQAGLKDGKTNLDILMQYLKNLISDTYENVGLDIREKINISWKYIFSSQKNGNYNEMVDAYYALKRKNALQNVEIDPLLFRKRQFTQNQLGNEQNQSNNMKKTNNFLQPAEKKSNNNNNNNNNKLNNQKTPKLTLNNDSSVAKAINESFETFLKEQERIFKKNEKFNGNSSETNFKKTDANKVSEFWSKEAIKYINACREKFNGYNHITEKLDLVLNNANQGLLSYNDYRSLIHLQNFIK